MKTAWVNFAYLVCVGLYFLLCWLLPKIGHKDKTLPGEDHARNRYPGR
jgi:hypothetical protein